MSAFRRCRGSKVIHLQRTLRGVTFCGRRQYMDEISGDVRVTCKACRRAIAANARGRRKLAKGEQ